MNLNLSLLDLAFLSPLLILLGGALLLILIESFAEKKAKIWSFPITIATLLLALYATYVAPSTNNPLLTPWIQFDGLARFFNYFFLAVGIGVAFLSYAFFQQFDMTQGEYFFLLLSCLFGVILIAMSADFLSLFLGLETLSLSLYILCGYMKKWNISHESAIKYFLLGSIAAALLLYGIALVYGATGSTRFDALEPAYGALLSPSHRTLFLAGIALITLGLAFKAAIVPFHFWAPDVYEGASNPVTAFMAIGTKAGAFAAFMRVFTKALPQFDPLWNQGLAFLVYPTLIYANFVAMKQTQMRRFFAYSGISHAGFLLISLAAGGAETIPSMLFYLVVYALATLGAFSVLAYLDDKSEGVTIKDLQGLFRRSPFLAVILALCLLTLGGIPPTAGFFAKFYIFKVAFEAGYYGLVVIGLLTSILAAYYYLRFVTVMFAEAPLEEGKPASSWPAAVVGVISLAGIVLLSCYPAPLMKLIDLANK